VQNSDEGKPLKLKTPIHPKPHTLTKENFYQKKEKGKYFSCSVSVAANKTTSFIVVATLVKALFELISKPLNL
jgi:hypothetical protein